MVSEFNKGCKLFYFYCNVVTQSMPTTPAQSSTSIWWIMFLVSVLVVIIAIVVYMAFVVYMYYVPPCSVLNVTVTSPIDEYALKLREKYNKTLTRHKDPNINKYPAAGPTAPAVPFIPLKLIRLKSYEKKAAEFLHSIDKEILEHDNFEKIEIDDLLRPLPNKRLRFVLITGEPGIGKSRLAKELTLQWVNKTDELLTHYRIVILIQLRFETYQKAENIKDLLIDFEDINKTEVMSSINKTRGAGVLWILDGFDELPHHLRSNSTSIFIQLIKGDILSNSTVIVTSRHAAIDPLLTFLEDDSKHIALRGFGSNEILEYASKYFKNDTIVSKFQSFYSGNTVIENMLYNPINCFIMCKVFTDFIHTKNNNNKHPTTMTGIYNHYVRALLKRHLIDHKVIDVNYEVPPHLIRKIDFNNSELSSIWKHFHYLSKVAYNSVMKQEYVFGKELHNVLKLSMIDTIISFSGFDKDESSSFIHTTLQEYFAAIYLVNNPDSMFTKNDLEKNSNLEVVLIFYVGLSKHIDREVGTLDMLKTYSDEYHITLSSLLLRCIYENDLLLYNKDYNLDPAHTWNILPINKFECFIAGYIVAAHNITLRINVSHSTELTAFKNGLHSYVTSIVGKFKIKLEQLDFYVDPYIDPMAIIDLPSDAALGLQLFLKLNSASVCQIISKFPLLEELIIIVLDNFYCHSTISEHPLVKLKNLKSLVMVITSHRSIFELFKQLIDPGQPLKEVLVLTLIYTIDMHMQILKLAPLSSLDELIILTFSNVIIASEHSHTGTLEISWYKGENSLIVNYYELFVHHLGTISKEIQLSSFTSFVYYKVKNKVVHRLKITIYSEPETSLNDFISAFTNFTSKMNITTNLNATDYINYRINLSGSMYTVVSPADPVSYKAGKTATDYRIYKRIENFLNFLEDTWMDDTPILIADSLVLFVSIIIIIVILDLVAIICCCYLWFVLFVAVFITVCWPRIT